MFLSESPDVGEPFLEACAGGHNVVKVGWDNKAKEFVGRKLENETREPESSAAVAIPKRPKARGPAGTLRNRSLKKGNRLILDAMVRKAHGRTGRCAALLMFSDHLRTQWRSRSMRTGSN